MKLLRTPFSNKIIFDVNPLISKEITGVGVYTRELLINLAGANPDVTFIAHYFGPKPKKNSDLPLIKNVKYRNTRLISQRLANQARRIGINIPIELLAKTFARYVFYPAYLSRGSISKIKSVVTVHDLAFINNKETLSEKNQKDLERFMPNILKKASLVLCVSNSTKHELIRHFKVDDEKIMVHPVPPRPAQRIYKKDANSYIHKIIGPKKFLLFVGTIEPRKNIETLVKAFTLLPLEIQEKYSLVIAGGTGWKSTNIQKYIEKAKLNNNSIVTTGFVSEKQKHFLYSECSAFVSASLEEGFGIPILEAGQYGKPSLLSNIPVFHEVAGSSALYFNEKDPNDISMIMKKFINNEDLRTKLSNNSKINIKKYSWKSIAMAITKKLQLGD